MSATLEMFRVGDMAVYPAHGVGKIESIESRKVGELEQSFYVMRFIESNMTVMIPTTTCDTVGLRNIISADDVQQVFAILNQRDVETESQPWNQRYREYTNKIKTGSIFEIAAVLRDLLLLRGDKDLSFGERKMVDTAKTLLVKEIALAKQIQEEQVAEHIDRIFS
ncbi:CarD family transcriptional regulator [Desulfurivibrio alkaliphilus]|uniref:Transcriptional regulator, CarD family n=1 Tax=Desulfurivibrio alkaliphilus (strain DSM 19089 / UNIQEM U267 / AHT2) TaxID=589865 RepID=D6Z154_DESAT|nr:CarD family transcriptional regulator [Desulfurivibrio alkaliphilus]ADH85309.1 transcriptional regulator, CarD family [Desulfurivibrio alkaliphilus AHT 2]